LIGLSRRAYAFAHVDGKDRGLSGKNRLHGARICSAYVYFILIISFTLALLLFHQV
jgi:hypothetical protein